MIYTLEWIELEADAILNYWNGKDETFVDGNGEKRTQDDVEAAQELVDKVREIRELLVDLKI